jgi:hypothetical protein
MPGLKETLTKKVGPLPVWAWGGVAIGGIAVARYAMAKREAGGAPSSDLGLNLGEGAFPVDVTGRAPGLPAYDDYGEPFPLPDPIFDPLPQPPPVTQPPTGGYDQPPPQPAEGNCTCTHTHRHGREHHGRDHGNDFHSHSHSHTKVSCGGRGCNHGS